MVLFEIIGFAFCSSFVGVIYYKFLRWRMSKLWVQNYANVCALRVQTENRLELEENEDIRSELLKYKYDIDEYLIEFYKDNKNVDILYKEQ